MDSDVKSERSEELELDEASSKLVSLSVEEGPGVACRVKLMGVVRGGRAGCNYVSEPKFYQF